MRENFINVNLKSYLENINQSKENSLCKKKELQELSHSIIENTNSSCLLVLTKQELEYRIDDKKIISSDRLVYTTNKFYRDLKMKREKFKTLKNNKNTLEESKTKEEQNNIINILTLSGFANSSKFNIYSLNTLTKKILSHVFEYKKESINKIVKDVLLNKKLKINPFVKNKALQIFKTELKSGQNQYDRQLNKLTNEILFLIESEKIKNHIFLENRKNNTESKMIKDIDFTHHSILLKKKNYGANILITELILLEKKTKKICLKIKLNSQLNRLKKPKVVHSLKVYSANKTFAYWLMEFNKKQNTQKGVSLKQKFFNEELLINYDKKEKFFENNSAKETKEFSEIYKKLFDDYYKNKILTLISHVELKEGKNLNPKLNFNYEMFFKEKNNIPVSVQRTINNVFVIPKEIKKYPKYKMKIELDKKILNINKGKKKISLKKFNKNFIEKYYFYLKKYKLLIPKKLKKLK